MRNQWNYYVNLVTAGSKSKIIATFYSKDLVEDYVRFLKNTMKMPHVDIKITVVKVGG